MIIWRKTEEWVLETRSSDQLSGPNNWSPLGVLALAAPSAWDTLLAPQVAVPSYSRISLDVPSLERPSLITQSATARRGHLLLSVL